MIDRRDLFRLRMWTNDYNWDWGDYKMIYDVECRDYSQNTMLSVCSFEELLDNHDTYNIMLCTGIKDSNGKLIYENDIIEIAYNEQRKVKYIVKFGEHIPTYEQLASVGFYIQELEDGSVWKLNNDKRTITTIIGNIYETEEFMHLQATNELPSDKFMQSMIDNYSDNDEHSDGSIEEAYKQFNDLIKDNK